MQARRAPGLRFAFRIYVSAHTRLPISYVSDAEDYVKHIEKRIVLIDGKRLAELLIEHGVGVTEVATYAIKKLDLDFFDESE
jgi:restriction system protein